MNAEVRSWVETRARYLGATIGAVVNMALRAEMEREAAKARADVAE
jgi:hypothetical protein